MCDKFNPLNSELNPIRHLLALVDARHIVHVSRVRVKILFGYKNYGIDGPKNRQNYNKQQRIVTINISFTKIKKVNIALSTKQNRKHKSIIIRH